MCRACRCGKEAVGGREYVTGEEGKAVGAHDEEERRWMLTMKKKDMGLHEPMSVPSRDRAAHVYACQSFIYSTSFLRRLLLLYHVQW
jgi:hypothetical protein